MMSLGIFKVFIVIAVVVAVFASITSQNEAKKKHFPYQVSIRVDIDAYKCGGAIVSEKFILTAAQCVMEDNNNGGSSLRPYDVDRIVVIAGSNHPLLRGVHARVEEVIVHEDYDGFQNNLALLKLRHPLKLTGRISTIPLTDHEAVATTDGAITVSGWEKNIMRTSSAIPLVSLKWLEASAAPSKDTCAGEMLSKTEICLSFDGNNSFRIADVGGPAVQGGKLIGIACGTMSGNEHVFTNLFCFNDWIQSNLNK